MLECFFKQAYMTNPQPASVEFLAPDECAEIDRALMTSGDRFSTRVAIYSLRALKQIAQQSGDMVAELSAQQIADWVEQDPALNPEHGFDQEFKVFFGRLVISSLKPLRQISQESGVAIEALTASQVVSWFEKAAKLRVEQSRGSTVSSHLDSQKN